MKDFIKLGRLLIVAIVVMAVVSCTPEAELTPYNWKDYNQQFDPSNTNQTVQNFVVNADLGLSVPVLYSQEVDITFPASADVLRETNVRIESKLKEFLSFSHFTNPAAWTVGQTSTFAPIENWSFIRRNSNTVTVKIEKPFVAADSNVLLKIDGTKYTYARGIKMDMDDNGTAGEAVYDDFYAELSVAGSTNTDIPRYNQSLGWTINLLTPLGGSFITAVPTTLAFDIGTTTISLSASDPDAAITERNNICNSFTSRFIVQKNNESTGWRWQDVSGTVSWVPEDNRFRFPQTTVEDMTAYRVVWNGSTIVSSANQYYGVNQRINIHGSGLKHGLPKVETDAGFYWNIDTHAFLPQALIPDIMLSVNRNSIGKNVVLEFELFTPVYKPGGEDTTAYYFKEYTQDVFKSNFKIASTTSGTLDVNVFQDDANVSFIPISSVEFIRRDLPETGTSGFNVIRIALDPDYTFQTPYTHRYLYINNKLGMADDIRTFGTTANWENGFYQIYNLGYNPPF